METALRAFKEKDPNGNGLADELPWVGDFKKFLNSYKCNYGFTMEGDRFSMRPSPRPIGIPRPHETLV
jgi:hypothetical protein